MNLLKSKKQIVFMLLTAVLFLSVCLSISKWISVLSIEAEHRLMLQNIIEGTDTLLIHSRGILYNEESLPLLQSRNDENIALFQQVANGNIKREIPSVFEVNSDIPLEIVDTFNAFSDLTSALIKNRMQLDRLKKSQQKISIQSKALVAKSEALIQGLTATNGAKEHLVFAYQTALNLMNVYTDVILAYEKNLPPSPFPINAIKQDLDRLSIDKNAPASPTIKRSASNLMGDISEFHEIFLQLEEHQAMESDFLHAIDQLKLSNSNLNITFSNAVKALQQPHLLYQYMTLILSIACLGAAVMAGASFTPLMDNSRINMPSNIQPVRNNIETASPNFEAQLKTDKNKLMNDIRPIAEGILYIQADEFLESTGDIARCFNQSRASLAQKIDDFKAVTYKLENQFINQAPSAKKEITPTAIDPIDLKPIIDLTFKANAELDGLQRRLHQLIHDDKDLLKSLIIRAMKAERLLDEIRIRIKKEIPDLLGSSSNSDKNPIAHHENTTKLLIDQLVQSLEEIKTKAPDSRKKRA